MGCKRIIAKGVGETCPFLFTFIPGLDQAK